MLWNAARQRRGGRRLNATSDDGMRAPQAMATYGSLRWLQRLFTHREDLLDHSLQRASVLGPWERVTWVSPRSDDEWAEYRDGDFLSQLNLGRLRPALAKYWPARGPQWDALGLGPDRRVFLVEAKTSVAELASSLPASDRSLPQITAALEAAKAAFGVDPSADWLNGYYQYAIRLAHLYFLEQHSVPATLVFLYFLGDTELKGPATADAWRDAVAPVYRHLGLSAAFSEARVCNVFMETRLLAGGAA
jgi:hypothetical protein